VGPYDSKSLNLLGESTVSQLTIKRCCDRTLRYEAFAP
jgi:hypothetical protein